MNDQTTRDLVPAAEASPRTGGLQNVRVVHDAVPTLDTARFEHMQRIATVMAQGSLVPETLRKKDKDTDHDHATVLANCFLVVNQAVRWGMDPFAVAQCTSVIHGRLCYEGKLVHAVLETKLGVRLRYTFNDKTGDALGVVVSGTLPGEQEAREIDGTVAQWRTTGSNSPWTAAANWKRQLRYRGAREWARAHAPGVLLGVYSDDELDGLADARMRDVTPLVAAPPAPPLKGPAPPAPKPAEEKYLGPVEEYLADLDVEFSNCKDVKALEAAWANNLEATERLGRGDRQTAESHYERHVQRIKGTGKLL